MIRNDEDQQRHLTPCNSCECLHQPADEVEPAMAIQVDLDAQAIDKPRVRRRSGGPLASLPSRRGDQRAKMTDERKETTAQMPRPMSMIKPIDDNCEVRRAYDTCSVSSHAVTGSIPLSNPSPPSPCSSSSSSLSSFVHVDSQGGSVRPPASTSTSNLSRKRRFVVDPPQADDQSHRRRQALAPESWLTQLRSFTGRPPTSAAPPATPRPLSSYADWHTGEQATPLRTPVDHQRTATGRFLTPSAPPATPSTHPNSHTIEPATTLRSLHQLRRASMGQSPTSRSSPTMPSTPSPNASSRTRERTPSLRPVVDLQRAATVRSPTPRAPPAPSSAASTLSSPATGTKQASPAPSTPRSAQQTVRPLLSFAPLAHLPPPEPTHDRRRRRTDPAKFEWDEESGIMIPKREKKRRRISTPTSGPAMRPTEYDPATEYFPLRLLGPADSSPPPSAPAPSPQPSARSTNTTSVTPASTVASVGAESPSMAAIDAGDLAAAVPRSTGSPQTSLEARPRQTSARRTVEIYTAIYVPSINERALERFDPVTFLRDPDIRHELLFDKVEIITPTGQKERAFSMSNSQTVEEELYWRTLDHEIQTGCRCLRWILRHHKTNQDGVPRLEDRHQPDHNQCSCGKWLPQASMQEYLARAKITGDYPSRFILAIEHLKRLVTSLMSWSDKHAGHEASQSSESAKAAVHRLVSALDSHHLAAQLRNGTLGNELFHAASEAIKFHCAPSRDCLVDNAVDLAESGSTTLALRKMFRLMDYMKVDNLKYAMVAFRNENARNGPKLLRSELQLKLNDDYLEESHTQAWLRAASTRVMHAASIRDRTHLLGRCLCRKHSELIHRSVADGIVDLAFQMWEAGVEDSAPMETGTADSVPPGSGPIAMPEVLHKDERRVRDFALRIIETYHLGVILIHFRALYMRHHPDTNARDMDEIIAQERLILEHLPGKVPSKHSPNVKPGLHKWCNVLANCIVHGVRDRMERDDTPDQEKAAGIDAIALQLELMELGDAEQKTIRSRLRTVIVDLLHEEIAIRRYKHYDLIFMDGYDYPVCRCSAIKQIQDRPPPSPIDDDEPSDSRVTQRTRNRDFRMRQHEKMAFWSKCASGLSPDLVDAITQFGFAPVVQQIHDAVRSILPLVCLHLKAYAEFYGGKGMLIGSGQPTKAEMKASKKYREAYDKEAQDMPRRWHEATSGP